MSWEASVESRNAATAAILAGSADRPIAFIDLTTASALRPAAGRL
ncbi:hypothetical protein [Mycobacterium sp. HUMS_1102779]